MAKKIYDFLPGHLKNSELETIFDTTLDRAFSSGEMEKTKAFVGRKEKGIFKSSDIYLSFPSTAYARDNYGLEPTFSNRDATDSVFYDDLLNAIYNKGSLTNDHRRLFKSTLETVQLPIDLDKFVNFSMYYWVSPGFFTGSEQSTANKHYVTIDKGNANWWSSNNSWYHYDDIKSLITDANFKLIAQALRPIIEFDKDIELSDKSAAVDVTVTAGAFVIGTKYRIQTLGTTSNNEWNTIAGTHGITPLPTYALGDTFTAVEAGPTSTGTAKAIIGDAPTFKSYNSSNVYVKDVNIFHYVIGSTYVTDTELGFKPKLQAGDYHSEFVFNIDLLETSTYKYNTDYKKLMITSTFDYRNLRQEIGDKVTVSEIELLQQPKSFNAIDLYVDGSKQIGNYVYNSTTKKITLTAEVSGNIYVDYCTDTPVVFDGQTVFQRLNPAVEYNVDNTTYYNTEMTYSLVYEHLVRIIETVSGLTGSANAANNYRTSGTNSEKLRFADKGSILIRNSIDIKEAYFALTREDYNPIKATEFLSGAYNGYKNKLLTTIQSIIDSTSSESKTDLEILEEAITIISLGKHKSVSIFRDSDMVNFGEATAHYQSLDVSVIDGATEQVMPTFTNSILNDKDVTVILNNVVQRLNVDYTLSTGATEINFITARSTSDVITVRHYSNTKETYIPPSATSLNIAPAYQPESITDSRYSSPVNFIRGHDGSLVPEYGTRVDDILLAFETLIFNNLTDNTSSKVDSMNYGIYDSASNDYTNAEKKYIMYPFFKKWMMRNNIDNLNNDDFDANDYKTWNYRAKDENTSGYWRGQLIHTYGTDRPTREPWKVIKYSQKPAGFDTWYGPSDYLSSSWWDNLILYVYNTTGKTIPNPVDGSGNLKTPEDLFFGGSITSAEIALMDQAWEFGDNSPVELAWTRSSEFAFVEFILMLLTKPFQVMYDYRTEMKNIITYSNKNEGIDTDLVIADKDNYSFKLGSKLGGFVNNFKLQTENNSLSNSRFTELPADDFDLFVHSGVPNRSEFFSAIVLEKVSLDLAHPTYAFANLSTYVKGDIVLNSGDGKYYKRKVTTLTTKEQAAQVNFDYSGWSLVSQPKTNKFGFRIHGYDEINPTFYSMSWDKASGEKAFSTAGDKLKLKQWQPGEYYRMDSYILWNDTPYVCLTNHTATTLFDDNIKDWKPVTEWPRVNKVEARGYKELVDDTLKNYNYGDILESVDDVAHLILGYQHYLKLVGWEFTDTSEFGDVIDWENLLYKFLEWQSEIHEIGDFITLTPLLTGGSFDATYGVASVTTETFKNYYRVIDSAGRLIPNTELDFHTDGAKLIFTSTVPIYGMKMDIRDIEHAFVVDRTDSYGDIVYDPHTHTRNLRMQIDCNRTIDWDGTMAVDGYIVNDNQLIPNFDTMIEDTRHYRDTLVDQSLSVINKLKSNHYGYTTRAYLTNHGVERESQLEFYKGFLSHKGTNSSINKIVNNNSNFENITHSDIWAVKLSDYGHESNKFTMTKDITVSTMIKDPYLIDYADPTKQLLEVSGKKNIALKTTGYVDEADVNYVTSTHESLVNLTDSTLYEGDISWVQADDSRNWDVVRLSEISEISYVGETSDNQLYIGTTNAIDVAFVDKPIYLKISADQISPTIAGYYMLASNGTNTVSGGTVHEYLVFEEDLEPLIVEIDNETANSVFVPTNTDSGVEAIGSVSNPVFANGDIIVIDGTTFTYAPSGTTSTGITILGTIANPVVSEGEQARFVIYNAGGLVENGTNTTVTFSGTVATTTSAFSSTVGDEVTIDGTTLTVDYAGSQSITETTTATRSSTLTTGNTVVIDGITKTIADLTVTGTVSSPVMASTKPITINGDTITLTSGDDLAAIIIAINSGTTEVVASDVSNQLVLTTSVPQLTMTGGSLIDLGLSTTNSYTDSKLDNLAIDLTTITDITATVGSNNLMVITSSGSQMIISGTALVELGITAGTYLSNSNPTPNSVVNQINAITALIGVTAVVEGTAIKITSTNQTLDIVEVTSGAMGRLGFATTTIAIDATDTIVSDLNAQVFQGSTTTATRSDRQVLITSSESSIVTSNILGNPLSDIGITSGTYSNTASSSPTALEFASQITAASDISVGVSSDGRMIFTNDTVQMSFSGTTQAILTKIGLVLTYSNVTSSANFKAMIWKSIRHTIGVNGATLTEFNTTLGLNSVSKLWIDEYDSSGWAVLNYDPSSGFTVHARQAKVIDTDLTKRLIIQDGEKSTIHQVYDPLNLKLHGAIMSKLKHVMWTDPAKYDTITSNDIWLDERLDEIWWDTDQTRFYRYNDYGDANGNLNVDFVRKYWGRIVPSSTVTVKKWTKSRKLPESISTYNTKKYYNEDAGKIVTDYFYWIEDDDTKELAMLIGSGGPKNMFLPVSTSSVVISNNSNTYDSQTVTASLEYQQETGLVKGHSDWKMLVDDSKSIISNVFLDDLTNSISNVTILKSYATKLLASHLTDVNFAIVTPVDKHSNTFMGGLTHDNIVVTTESGTVKASHLTVDGNNLKISKQHSMVVGDVLRVYSVEGTKNNWFTNTSKTHNNFASVINAKMSNKMLQTVYSKYAEYIDTNDIIFSLGNWYIDDSYKTINSFSYLSTTREFDMIEQYNNGIKSFKLKLPSHDEYYFEHEGQLQLVHRTNSALNVSFDMSNVPETGYTNYYNNAVGLQVHELMHLIRDYPDYSFINDIFFSMIKYLYSEKTYPSWLFKSSYFDLNLHNRELKQYAVYQRDSEADVLEYVKEAKPYHAKIREIKRVNSINESFLATTTIDEKLKLTLDFGNNSRYLDSTLDGGDYATSSPSSFNTIADGEYDQDGLLRNRFTPTSETTGFDTGLVKSKALESPTVRLQTYTGNIVTPQGATIPSHGKTVDKTQFYVYDMYGRGYDIGVISSDAISSFDGTTLVVTTASLFAEASKNNKQLIAVQKAGTSDVEFMMYDKKASTSLTISNRVLYTGVGHSFANNDLVYVLDTPLQLVLQDLM